VLRVLAMHVEQVV